jgi:prepilin-type N-terminal cleavage/methylation domain-containing protein
MKRLWLNQKGFTLIEMIIVVIIMGILAAVIIPQIAVTTGDAQLSTLQTDLTALRNAVEIYYAQHNSAYPGARDILTGAAPADDAAAATAFVQQLTRYTNAAGIVSDDVDRVNFPFGPYIKGGALPENPYNSLNTVHVDRTETDITVRVSDTSTGWKFYMLTGVLMADDGGHDTE